MAIELKFVIAVPRPGELRGLGRSDQRSQEKLSLKVKRTNDYLITRITTRRFYLAESFPRDAAVSFRMASVLRRGSPFA